MSKFDNILNFTILFHKVCADSYFMNCDMSYIWEKYQSMIGFNPKVRKDELEDCWQSVVLKDLDALSLKCQWYSKWKVDKKLDLNKERVLNYLCITNVNNLNPNSLIKLFEDYIGDVDMVRNDKYNHLHPLFKKFVDEYKDKHMREINIEILTR